jgi:hypothetical protein
MVFFLLIPLAGLGLLEGFCIYKARANGKRARLLAATPLAKVAELQDGLAKVQGQVVAFEYPLLAPLSGTRCVYYRFQVEEKRTHAGSPGHGGGSYWKTVINDIQSIPCGVDDGSGVAGIDLRAAELVLRPGTQARSGFFNEAPARLEQLLQERYGRSSKGWIFNKGMRYTETLLEESTVIVALGTAEATPGGNWQLGKSDFPCLVSDQSDEALRSSYRRWTVFWLVLAILVPAVTGGVIVLIGLGR